MQVNTLALTGMALHWAIAVAEDLNPLKKDGEYWLIAPENRSNPFARHDLPLREFRPSEDEKLGFRLAYDHKILVLDEHGKWYASALSSSLEDVQVEGETTLMAAMRSLALTTFGEVINLPADLADKLEPAVPAVVRAVPMLRTISEVQDLAIAA